MNRDVGIRCIAASLALLLGAGSHAAEAPREPRQERRQALEQLERQACDARCAGEAVARLKRAAADGDTLALIALERLRREGGAHAPGLADIIAVEIVRAERGDPIAAWRLAQRYLVGEGVDASPAESVRWLTVAAAYEDATWPKSAEAAFRLCEIYSRGAGVAADGATARDWCARAADAGHAGAALVLAQLQRLDG